jgi:hypothetical protein
VRSSQQREEQADLRSISSTTTVSSLDARSLKGILSKKLQSWLRETSKKIPKTARSLAEAYR